jgi:hypothetical protein
MMMDYIPGVLHEKLQWEHFFLINSNFVWMNCGPKRLIEFRESKDWDETESIDLVEGDIISVRFFKSSQTSSAYTYLERVIYNNGNIIEYKKESIISLGFIEKNLDPGKVQNKSCLFSDVTKIMERERKLESILC